MVQNSEDKTSNYPIVPSNWELLGKHEEVLGPAKTANAVWDNEIHWEARWEQVHPAQESTSLPAAAKALTFVSASQKRAGSSQNQPARVQTAEAEGTWEVHDQEGHWSEQGWERGKETNWLASVAEDSAQKHAKLAF